MDGFVVAMFVAGLGALVFGAEMLVRHASALSLKMGIPPLIIGLTIVAFGTGAPELAVGVYAAWVGQDDLLMGNIVGSNIANILLVLGIGAVLAPIAVNRQVIKLDAPVMIGASVLLFGLAKDGFLGPADGFIFVLGCTLYLVYLLQMEKTEDTLPATSPAEANQLKSSIVRHILWVCAGLALIILGSRWLINSAVIIAAQLGVSETFIGLTIVAVGTSLPEIATTIIACIRGERDLAIGNVVGSCTFNILAVLGISSLIAPNGISVSHTTLSIDLPIMLIATLGCLPLFFTHHSLSRLEGGIFLGYYGLYTLYLIFHAIQSPTAGLIGTVFWFALLPLTVIVTLIVTIQYRQQIKAGSALEKAA
ncbi:MAG: cation:H+ antiporter [Candidatus Latescibacterota bacterium]|jgi:cation:H+ antiporter